MPEGCAEELDEAFVGEFLAVEAFELAVVEEEIAGDSDAQRDLAAGYGYLDSGGFVARALGRGSVGVIGSGALVAFVGFVALVAFEQMVAGDAS